MSLEVSIEQGKLKGGLKTDLFNNKFYSFQGIPYAKPPTGELRFKAPVPPEKWSGTLDATCERSPSFARNQFRTDVIQGSEDCLFLNVYSKELPSNGENPNLPVMFYVHGGGFLYGSSHTDECGPEFLLTEDIVLVTINYRLGILGFLALSGSDEVTGNAGMKDVIQGLKWVQKNIAAFGGNPNNVTIFGESAGGAAVHSLMLSPLSKGLFHRAIVQSGSALNPWAFSENYNKEIADILHVENKSNIILETLQKKTSHELLELQETLLKGDGEVKLIALTVDSNAIEPYIPEDAMTLIQNGNFHKVPLMIGYTSAEGMLFEWELCKSDVDLTREKFKVPPVFPYKKDSPEYNKIKNEIIAFYLGTAADPKSAKYNYFTDHAMLYGIYLTAMLQSSKIPVFVYRVSIETSLNFFKTMLKIKEPGTCHADELGYLFKTATTKEIEKNSVEEVAIKRFVKLWTNFAKYGNPCYDKNAKDSLNITLQPITAPNLTVLNIDKSLEVVPIPEQERMDFWTNLLKKHANVGNN